MLSDKQAFDYENRRRRITKWLYREGKDPRDKIGYSKPTIKRTMYRLAVFDRWVWSVEDEYVSFPTQEHADRFMEVVAYSDKSQTHKKHLKISLKRYWKWRHHTRDDEQWDTDKQFTVSDTQKPQDYLTKVERQKIREAALEYGSIPAYKTIKCDTERRERLKPYVAEHIGKPADKLGVADWRTNDIPSWRYTSLVWVSLDTGLRPDEVGKAKTSWVDVPNSVLRIPKDESSKNYGNWEVSLRNDTARALERWLHERRHYPKYDDTEKLWLTNHGNPYNSRSLRRLLHRLCDRAGIQYDTRKMSWYSIRHSVGTLMTDEEDLKATMVQLRHKDPKTTMKYDAAPPGDRREALDKMG
jgi:integrase